jgi:predicted DCC family thiol-disulfide oxidoreductase YuxK
MRAMVTVWFDGGCPLCRREIAFMRRLDRRGRIDFVDVSSGNAVADCPAIAPRSSPVFTPAKVIGC